jgi:hypothetical protein
MMSSHVLSVAFSLASVPIPHFSRAIDKHKRPKSFTNALAQARLTLEILLCDNTASREPGHDGLVPFPIGSSSETKEHGLLEVAAQDGSDPRKSSSEIATHRPRERVALTQYRAHRASGQPTSTRRDRVPASRVGQSALPSLSLEAAQHCVPFLPHTG